MKKWLIFIIACIFSFGAFVGCGENNQDSSGGFSSPGIENSSPEDSTSEDSTPENSTPEDTPPEDNEENGNWTEDVSPLLI